MSWLNGDVLLCLCESSLWLSFCQTFYSSRVQAVCLGPLVSEKPFVSSPVRSSLCPPAPFKASAFFFSWCLHILELFLLAWGTEFRRGRGRPVLKFGKVRFGKFFLALCRSFPAPLSGTLAQHCCLTWRALFSPPTLSPTLLLPWQVELSIQSGCMTHVWTPLTAFPWLHLWTSSSCVYTEDCHLKSQTWTTSGKYVRVCVCALIFNHVWLTHEHQQQSSCCGIYQREQLLHLRPIKWIILIRWSGL